MVLHLQVTNLFLSMWQDAIIKLRRLMSPRNFIDIPYKDIRLAIQICISPKERVITTERAKVLTVIQGVGGSDDEFISDLRDSEAKLRLLDGIKAKPGMSVTEMTESLQFRSQAMAFASSSLGNKPSTVREEFGFNFTKTFRKPNEKITANESNNMCTRRGGKPHSSRPCPALKKKCNTCEKVCHFSKKCRSKTPPNSSKYKKQKNFCG